MCWLVPADAPKVNYRLPGFFRKFIELQKVMWTTNAGLTDRHSYDSRPSSWPTLKRGIVSPLRLTVRICELTLYASI
jgi:dolichyl-phosphate-mannose-protein mannosyltransferase